MPRWDQCFNVINLPVWYTACISVNSLSMCPYILVTMPPPTKNSMLSKVFQCSFLRSSPVGPNCILTLELNVKWTGAAQDRGACIGLNFHQLCETGRGLSWMPPRLAALITLDGCFSHLFWLSWSPWPPWTPWTPWSPCSRYLFWQPKSQAATGILHKSVFQVNFLTMKLAKYRLLPTDDRSPPAGLIFATQIPWRCSRDVKLVK